MRVGPRRGVSHTLWVAAYQLLHSPRRVHTDGGGSPTAARAGEALMGVGPSLPG
jgi:hypothetical protein